MKRIKFLYTHPIQYFAPLLREIDKAAICEATALYCENTAEGYFDKEFGKAISWDLPLMDGYQSVILPNSRLSRLGSFFRLSNFSIRKHIGRKQAEVLAVHGWGYCTAVFAIIWGKLTGTKIWLRGESPLNQELQKSFLNRLFKRIFLQFFLFRFVDKFLYIGKQNYQFYQHHGVAEDKLVFAPYCVDNDTLQRQVASSPGKAAARAALQLPEQNFVVLFSGKLIDKKRPLDLVKAFHQAAIPHSTLVLLGDGALMNEIQTFIRTHGVANILLPGFVNQSALAPWFFAADIFVLPSVSGETWGLVNNEAMNFGLPILVSNLVGSAADLVEEGINGYSFEPGNIGQLSTLLQKAAAAPEWRTKAGKASRDKIKAYSYQTIIKNLENTLNS